MSLGEKIKKYRHDAGLTQKELAEQLHVTYQAVSKWENDESEPPLNTIKDLTKVFGCTPNDLFESEEEAEIIDQLPSVVESEEEEEEDHRQVLTICEVCNRPIYDSSDIHRVETIHKVYTGRGSSHTDHGSRIHCTQCYEKKIKSDQAMAHAAYMGSLAKAKKRRIHSFIWPGIALITCVALLSFFFATGNMPWGIAMSVLAVGLPPFIACMILDNNKIFDIFASIAQFAVLKTPHVIIGLSFGGIAIFIIFKILMIILAMIVMMAVLAFALVVCMVCSAFVYPFAIARNFRNNDIHEERISAPKPINI